MEILFGLLISGLGIAIGKRFRDKSSERLKNMSTAEDWKGWVWPVPITEGRIPKISQGFRDKNSAKPHLGVDIMFPKLPSDANIGPPRGTKPSASGGGFFVPEGALIFAAGPGKIWTAGESEFGKHIQIDHGDVPGVGGMNTFYQHLASFSKEWKRGDEVRAGDVLGVMGGAPNDFPDHLVHLHFETWFPVRANAKDPVQFLRLWNKIPSSRRVA
jgi:murein DD-endopeptidase MepM/ murein hydrolase activator NlpD